MSLFKDKLSSILNETITMGESLSTPEYDIEGIQTALNLIESFTLSAA